MARELSNEIRYVALQLALQAVAPCPAGDLIAAAKKIAKYIEGEDDAD